LSPVRMHRSSALPAPRAQSRRGQVSFDGGAIACTSIAWHWAVAVLEGLVPSFCSEAQYDIIASTAIAAHTMLARRLHVGDAFLNSAELLHYFREREMRYAEFGVYSAPIELDASMRLHALHVDAVEDLVAQHVPWAYAVLLTHNMHTTALVSTADVVVLLDSLPAVLHELPRAAPDFRARLHACLARALPAGGAEGSAMLVRK
jgi:hypothetical protein